MPPKASSSSSSPSGKHTPPPPPKTGSVPLRTGPSNAAVPPRAASSSSSPRPSQQAGQQRAGNNSHNSGMLVAQNNNHRGFDGPIRFVDDEVAKMHAELERRQREQRTLAPSQTHRSKRAKKSGLTLTGFLVRVSVFYVLIAYYLVCPTDESKARAVCRQLDRFAASLHSLEPRVRPAFDYANRQAEPYISQFHSRTDPYLAKVKPVFDRADSYIEPWTKKAGQVYDSHIYPGLLKGVGLSQSATKPYVDLAHKQYQKSIAPSVEWYSRSSSSWYKANAEKHVKTADRFARTYSNQAYQLIAPAAPFAHHHLKHTIIPGAKTAYQTSHETYFEHLHPQVVVAQGQLHRFYRTRIVPAWNRFYSLYIAPQVARISERVFEYRSKKTSLESEARVKAAEAEILHNREDGDHFADFVAEQAEQILIATSVPVLEDQLEATAVTTPIEPETSVNEDADKAQAVAQKRASLEALHDKYEKEIENLGQIQRKLVTDRLVAVRNKADSDIFDRFDSPLLRLNSESSKSIARLNSFLERDDGRTKEQKLADGETLSQKALARIVTAGEKVKAEADRYRDQFLEKELDIIAAATQSIEQLVSKAQTEVGHGWTYLEDSTAKDWARYHQFLAAQRKWDETLTGLQTGAVFDSRVASIRPSERLAEVKAEVDSVVSELEAALDRDLKKAKGSLLDTIIDKAAGRGGETKAPAEPEVENAALNLASSAASMASVARESASAALSAAADILQTDSIVSVFGGNVAPTPTNVIGSLSSAASQAAASVQTVLGDASQAAISAIGIEPSPTNLQQTAHYIAVAASKSITSAASVASKNVIDDLPSSAGGLGSSAASFVGSIATEAASTVSAAGSSASSAASDAASVISSYAAPHPSFTQTPIIEAITSSLSSAVSQASSLLHDATRTTAEGPLKSISSVAAAVKSTAAQHIEL